MNLNRGEQLKLKMLFDEKSNGLKWIETRWGEIYKHTFA